MFNLFRVSIAISHSIILESKKGNDEYQIPNQPLNNYRQWRVKNRGPDKMINFDFVCKHA